VNAHADQYADELSLVDGGVIDVRGFSVVPDQAPLNMNQPLFYDLETGRWCMFAGVCSRGLNVRYLDGTYDFGVDPGSIANLGIQA